MLGIEIGNKINFKHFVNLEKQKEKMQKQKKQRTKKQFGKKLKHD